MSARDDRMDDRFRDRLSEFLDGELPAGEARECEAHLGTCAECREELEALRAIRDRAAALGDVPAPEELWPGIASRIAAEAPGRVLPLPRRRIAAWVLPAAAAAVITVVAALAFFAGRGVTGRAASNAVPAPAASGEAALASYDPVAVDGEVAELQRALDRGRGKLDPQTVAVLEENLRVIRRATDDARRALAADPANRELQDYFAATVQSKLRLMRRATAMAGV